MLVSIIINCFNGEKYLRKSLESVIAQTYKNWEVIFWDNQSTDKSAEIFKSFNESRFKYYYAPKHSEILYEAKSYAVKEAKGDFIAFLDADDWWLPRKLEKQIPLFQDPEVGLVYGNVWLFYEKENKKIIYKKKILPKGKILNDLLLDYSIGSPTYVIRKKYIEDPNYNFNKSFHIIGDFDLNVRLAYRYKVDCIQDPVAFARIHGKNESILKKDLEIKELKIWLDQMQKNPDFSSLKNLNEIKNKILYLETKEDIFNGRIKEGFLKAFNYPFSFKKLKLIIALISSKFKLTKLKKY